MTYDRSFVHEYRPLLSSDTMMLSFLLASFLLRFFLIMDATFLAGLTSTVLLTTHISNGQWNHAVTSIPTGSSTSSGRVFSLTPTETPSQGGVPMQTMLAVVHHKYSRSCTKPADGPPQNAPSTFGVEHSIRQANARPCQVA
jgi:hypothetical protein